MADKVKIPARVFNGLEAVRLSGSIPPRLKRVLLITVGRLILRRVAPLVAMV